MRRLATVCLGLALSAPATAWSQAGGPMPGLILENEQSRPASLESSDYQHMKRELQQAQMSGMDRYYGGHVCEKCARKLPTRIAVDPSTPTSIPSFASYQPASSGSQGCAMCQQGQTANPSGVAYVGGPTQMAGVAYVGGPSGGEGDTRYLGVVGSIEPVPVGVVRTNYNQISESSPSNGMMRAGYDPMHNPGMRMPPSGSVPAPMGAPMASPGHRRTSVIGHMLGLGRPRAMSEARRQQERDAHAMIRYDSNELPPSQLPASMVYPR